MSYMWSLTLDTSIQSINLVLGNWTIATGSPSQNSDLFLGKNSVHGSWLEVFNQLHFSFRHSKAPQVLLASSLPFNSTSSLYLHLPSPSHTTGTSLSPTPLTRSARYKTFLTSLRPCPIRNRNDYITRFVLGEFVIGTEGMLVVWTFNSSIQGLTNPNASVHSVNYIQF